MIVQKSVKVRIYPRESDKELLAKHFGVRRFIYNKFLEIREKEYQENGKTLNFYDCCALVTQMKKDPSFAWLKEVNSQSIIATLKDLDDAYKRFFRKISKLPKFKTKRDARQSFRVPQYFTIDWESKTLKIPKFKKPFKFRGSYTGVPVKINSITISRNASGKYFASIQGEFEIKQKKSTGEIIGVDLGIKSLLVDSNGKEIENGRFLKKQLKRLKYLNRQLSKKKKESKTRSKARIRLAIQHEKVVNQRNNYLHRVSSKLIDENQVIVLEDLGVKNMVKNRRLAQAISDVSWGSLVSMLKYKAAWHNRQIILIDRWFPSSKTCSCCGHVLEELVLDVRKWTCPSCGIEHDRDVNAAKNILQQGLKVLSGSGAESDIKQKPEEALALAGSVNPEDIQPKAVC
jgi:putative transposase